MTVNNNVDEWIKAADTCFREGSRRKKLFRKNLERFDKLKKLPYDEKIEYSRKIIERALKEFKDNIAISCSFGKDSTLVLSLVREFNKDIKVTFSNTGVEYPETIEFKKLLVKKWKLNYYEVGPIKTFWQCVKEYGYPDIRYWSKTAKKRGITNYGTPKCCTYVKEKPLRNFYKKNKIEAIFLGLTWEESYQRRWTVIRYGDYYYTKKHKIWKIHPIAYWTVKEVWRYTKKNNIPTNKIYLTQDRCGCMPCTGHLRWENTVGKANPALLRKILKEKFLHEQRFLA